MTGKNSFYFGAAAFMALLGGCQERTGYDSADLYLVIDYKDRVELSRLLKTGASHCDFGCMNLCTMEPEPRIFVKEGEAMFVRYSQFVGRAKDAGLLLEVPKSSIIIDDFDAPETLDPADTEKAENVKRSCLQRQGEHLESIEALLEKLEYEG